MDLGWETHFYKIIVVAWQSYLTSEYALSAAFNGDDAETLEEARFTALREGGSAAFYLHHFSDIVKNDRPDALPQNVKSIREIREWVESNCRWLRTAEPIRDVSLLADVADALKHSHLTNRVSERQVATRDAVLTTNAGFGGLRYGEGKFGGVEQVLVLTNAGNRALSSVLQNVIDAWRVSLNLPMPPLNEP